MVRKNNDLMDKIISLCKRRGFIYPSSEIYGGFAAIYDYGPYGIELENLIKRAWWKNFVQLRNDVVGLDSQIFMNPKIWEASGHANGFSDPLVECKECHTRSRADKLLNEIGIKADEKINLEELNRIFNKNIKKIKCPNCEETNFTEIKKFNLLVKSNLGNYTSDWNSNPSYLRGETCQGIYVNFKNVLDSSRVKIPFGIAQIGKVFRNEITARKFVFRTREFEQMEMEYFTKPEDEMKFYEELRKDRWKFFIALGIIEKNLKWHKHDNLVFYAKEAYDIEYRFPWGFDELEGVHARGNYDLTQHSKYSGIDMTYTDPETSEKYMPHIIESSVGVGRLLFAVLLDSYREEQINGEKRIYLRLNKKLAPIKIAIFPLLRNKIELSKKAKQVSDLLKLKYMCEYDDNGNIGKRYRRQDEIGTPYCVTIDFETLSNDTVTVRDRDTMKQSRIKINDLTSYFNENLDI